MLKSIKSLIRSFSLVCVVLAGCFIYPELHNSYLRYEVGESVVRVLHPTQFGGGTGFAVLGESGKEYIMTNRHVCEASVNDKIKINKPDGKSVMRKVIYRDDLHDLCLIEGVSGLDPLTIGSEPNEGDLHYVIGHPGLRDLTVSQGEYIGPAIVKLLDDVKTRAECKGDIIELSPFLQLMLGREFACLRPYRSYGVTSVTYPGNSGSPIVNKFGNLIAVVFAGSTEQERDNYAVPLSHIKRVLAKF